MRQLYDFELSGNCHKIRMLLALLSLEYERIDVDLQKKAQMSPAFLAMNPLHKVPVLNDDGFVLRDSVAILIYLTRKYGQAQWLEKLGLGQYTEQFEENAIELEHLPDLDHDVLKDIGIKAAGHRITILQAIAASVPPPEPSEDRAASGQPMAEPVEAERRQITVMFCDLQGSTELSQQLDPEDLRDVMRAYQELCTSLIARYEGFVARYMGDGVLAYFGYPQAHEDDAERAVLSGLSLTKAMTGLSADHGAAHGVELIVRVGIATGPVVVGDLIGEGAARENAVVGETPNLAARLQTLAGGNSVVVGPATFDLTSGQFDYADLGLHALKGISDSVHAWQAVAPTITESRFDAMHHEKLTYLVGREHEVGLLLDRWSQAKEGDGQVVMISGEAGIGKSRVIEALADAVRDDSPIRLRYQCSPYHTNSALYPIIVNLEQAARLTSDEPAAIRLAKLERLLADSDEPSIEVALFAALLSIPLDERYPALEMSSEQRKERTLDTLCAEIEKYCRRNPVLMHFEDMHWADPTTIEALDRFVERIQHLPCMLVMTGRPQFSYPWSGRMYLTFMTLNRLGRGSVNDILRKLAGGCDLPGDLRDHIIAKTDGVPLFVEELTKSVLESDRVERHGDRYELTGPLSTLEIPSTLHDSLMARLDRIPEVKGVAQTASAIGREFSHNMLVAVSTLAEHSLERAIHQLIQAELVFRMRRAADTRYGFKHALVQDAAYGSLLKSTRRKLHERIAHVIETQFPDRTQTEPEVLAYHHSSADLPEPAALYWTNAGNRALQRSADREAVVQFENASSALRSLPESDSRDRQEVQVHIGLFRALAIVNGWGSSESQRSLERIRELGERVGDSDTYLTVLVGDRVRHWVDTEYAQAMAVSDRIIALGLRTQSVDRAAFGELLKAWPSLALGMFEALIPATERILSDYDVDRHKSYNERYGLDLRVVALSVRGYAHLLRGERRTGAGDSDEAIEWARRLKHAGTLKWALCWAGAQPAAMRGDATTAGSLARELMTLKNRSPIDDAWGRLLLGWAIATGGDGEQGIALLEDGLSYLVDGGVKMFRSVHLGLLADICIEHGNLERAADALAHAHHHIEQTGERLWVAEISRLEGRLVLRGEQPDADQAARYFARAASLSREMGARALERRANADLAALN